MTSGTMEIWRRKKGKGEQSSEGPAEERTAALKDRALLWMNRYLAFNVQPRTPEPEELPEPEETTPLVGVPKRPGARPGRDAARRQAAAPRVARSIPVFAVGDQIADVYEVK